MLKYVPNKKITTDKGYSIFVLERKNRTSSLIDQRSESCGDKRLEKQTIALLDTISNQGEAKKQKNRLKIKGLSFSLEGNSFMSLNFLMNFI